MASKIDAGSISITLDDEERFLVPTLKVITRVSRQYGGPLAALEKVRTMDLDAFVFIIGLGLDSDERERKRLPEMVFSAGLLNLVAPVTKFMMVLANGGRPVDGDNDGDAEDKDGGRDDAGNSTAA